ncbi:MAG: hypothetical protein K6F84_06900 [Lachnospiraceae bacterium]|nr:hypothetical protein [Lachnospiraceae bacterium]
MSSKENYKNIYKYLYEAFVWLFLIWIGIKSGDESIYFLMGGFELFVLFKSFIHDSFGNNLGKLIKNRLHKEQYRNVNTIKRFSAVFYLLFSFILSLGMILAAAPICHKLFGADNIRYVIYILALNLFILGINEILSGFLVGEGFIQAVNVGYLLNTLFMLLSGIIFGSISYNYAVKVCALLKDDIYKGFYLAMGCAGAMLLSSFLIFIYYFIYYILVSRQRAYHEGINTVESLKITVWPLFKHTLFRGLSGFLKNIPFFLFIIFARNRMKEEISLASLGGFYSGFILTCRFFVTLIIISSITLCHKGCLIFNKGEVRNSRGFLNAGIHFAFVKGLGFSAFVCMGAKLISGVLCVSDVKAGTMLFRFGCVFIFFYALSFIVSECLEMAGSYIPDIILNSIGVVFFVLLIAFLPSGIGKNVNTIMDTFVIYSVVTFCLGMFIFYNIFGIRINFIKNLVLPLTMAALSAVVTGLITYALGPHVGYGFVFVIGIALYYLLYNLCLIFIRNFSEAEMKYMPVYIKINSFVEIFRG